MPSPDIHMREMKLCDGYVLRAFGIAKDDTTLLIVSKDDEDKVYKNTILGSDCDSVIDQMSGSTFEIYEDDENNGLDIIETTSTGLRMGFSMYLES